MSDQPVAGQRFRLQCFLPYGAAVLSALLLTSSFAPLEWAWAAWVAFVPLALVLWVKPLSWRESLAVGVLFGGVHFLTSIFWITEVSVLGWLAVVALMVPYPMLWTWGWNELVRRRPDEYITGGYTMRMSLFGACWWTGLEWLRGWLFTGFPWNPLGVSQAPMVGIIQIAEFGGVWLVSWLVVFTSLMLVMTFVRLYHEMQRMQPLKPHYDFSLSVLLVAAAFMYGIHVVMEKEPPVAELRIVAIQPDIPQDPWGSGMPSEQAIGRMSSLTSAALGGGEGAMDVNLVIWPETPIPGEIYGDEGFQQLLSSVVEEKRVALLAGSIVRTNEGFYNTALLYNPDENPQIYRKVHLVMMGEYVPLARWLPLLRRFTPPGLDFSSGTETGLLELHHPPVKIAPLICFEDIFGRLARRFASNGPDLFVNITNDGWFGRSPQSRQHLNNALFRAVEFRRPLIRCANNGVTAVIDEKGVIRQIVKDPVTGDTHEAGILRTTVAIPPQRTTLYQKTGDWAGWGSLLVGVGAVLTRLRQRRDF